MPSTLMPCSLSGRLDPRHTRSSGDNRSYRSHAGGVSPAAFRTSSFATVYLDGRVPLQMHMKQRIHVADSFWCGDDVNIVQEGEQPLTLQKLVLDCLQEPRVVPKEKRSGINTSPLLTTFSLINVVDNANLVFPQLRGMITIEHSQERQDLRTNLQIHQSLQHCSASR